MSDLPQIPTDRPVAFDVETTGLSWRADRVFGLAVAWKGDGGLIEKYYYDLRSPRVLDWARDQLPKAKLLIGHNSKFDALFCINAGIAIPTDRLDCTMIREALINEHSASFSLDAVSWKYLQERKHTDIWDKAASMFGGRAERKIQIGNLWQMPVDMVREYAAPDAELALRVWYSQEQEIAQQTLERVTTLERELLGVVVGLEWRGVGVDCERAETELRSVDVRLADAQREIDGLAGGKVNVNSPAQVRKLVVPYKDEVGTWRMKDGTALEPTEGGAPSLGSDAMRKSSLREAQLVVLIRSLIKTRDVFLRTYILEHGASGRIHASFNQTRTEFGSGTGTGRFSITDPALQQIPARDDQTAAITRSCFIPDRGQVWGCYDWSQVEFRTFAHYTNSPAIIAAYNENPDTDYHQAVSQLTGLPRNRDAKTGGANSKQLNLGLIFGEGEGRMAKEMGLPYYKDERGYLRAGPEAKEIFRKYHESIPGVKGMLEKAESIAKSRGYIVTPMGRRIRFPGGQRAHTAAGLLFQSTAADMMKVKLVELDRFLRGTGANILITVHDEFDVSFPPGSEALQQEALKLLERFDGEQTPIKLRVPIRASYGTGSTWYEASK